MQSFEQGREDQGCARMFNVDSNKRTAAGADNLRHNAEFGPAKHHVWYRASRYMPFTWRELSFERRISIPFLQLSVACKDPPVFSAIPIPVSAQTKSTRAHPVSLGRHCTAPRRALLLQSCRFLEIAMEGTCSDCTLNTPTGVPYVG